MSYGRFVVLNIDHPIVKEVQGNLVQLRDLRYYLLYEELRAIEEANEVFRKEGQGHILIEDYDLLGWALSIEHGLNERTSTEQPRRSQAASLMWVNKSKFGTEETGRISRTILELAALVKASDGKWTHKTRFTTSVQGKEPFTSMKMSKSLEKLVLKRRKKSNLEVDFLIPSGIIGEIVDRDADRGEHMTKNQLQKLHLLTDNGEATPLAVSLVNCIERLWLIEILISNADEFEQISKRIPLECLLYATGEANRTLTLKEISDTIGKDVHSLKDEIMRILSRIREIEIRLSDDEQSLEATIPSAGLEVCDSKTMVQRLAKGPLWYWLLSEKLSGTVIGKEVSLLPLRYTFIEDLALKLISKETDSLMIIAPAGWGKTGTLLLLAQRLEHRDVSIALYRGGTPSVRIPKSTILFVDDIDTLSVSSLNYLSKMQEEGFQIVMTLTQEFELVFSETLRENKRRGISIDYVPVRLAPLSHDDAVYLIKDNFANIPPDDIERVLNKITVTRNSPEVIAFLSMQWELIGMADVSLLESQSYSVFKTPRLLFDILSPRTNPFIEIDTELAALVIMNELGGHILSSHDKIVKKLAKEITKSERFPKYYKSFVEPTNIQGHSHSILDNGIRSLIHIARETDASYGLIGELFHRGLITRIDLEWAADVIERINQFRTLCTGIAKVFLERVLHKQTKRKQIELLPYVALIGSPKIQSADFIMDHYGWLKTFERNDFLKNGITPLHLSSMLDGLVSIINNSKFTSLETIVLPVFSLFQELWCRKAIIPQDEFNASYLRLLAIIARRRMQRGEFDASLAMFDDGIEIATKMHHKTSLVILLCDKIQLLRHISPVFKGIIQGSIKKVVGVAQSMETLDTRPFEIIVRNQEALALLWSGDIAKAEMAARKAEDLLISYEVSPPDIRRIPLLELVKSNAWIHIELGLCEYVKGNFSEARAFFGIARKQLTETRHEEVIARIIGYEAVVFCREKKIAEADRLVAFMNTTRFPFWAWGLSGSFIVYYYILYENSDIARSEESEELRRTQREFLPAEALPIIQWLDNLRRMVYHRKRQEYEICIELSHEFFKWLVESDESKDAGHLDWIRPTLSLVLRELALAYFERNETEKSAKSFLGSLVYWVPICGPREEYALDFIERCLMTLESKVALFSGWSAELEKETSKIVIEYVDEDVALAEQKDFFWIGINDFFSE